MSTPTPSVHSGPSRRFVRPRAVIRHTALWCIASTLAGAAWASTPGEKVVCTDAPRSAWLNEAQARSHFEAQRYVLVRFKVSRGNCHEFYAIEPSGAVVESYQHPVTGQTVRSTRIPPPDISTPTSGKPRP
ncbi:MAG: PepSY domain-containing protein [Burkholderiales bacterium]|nr:PepSY domain-containing protein [Burkholderiales bacterium]